MLVWRDVLAFGVAGAAVAGLAGLFILPAVYPRQEVLGYLPGRILGYELSVTKHGSRGIFDVRLDRGETLRVTAGPHAAAVGPGDRVCLRATRRGDLVQGVLVPMDRCAGP